MIGAAPSPWADAGLALGLILKLGLVVALIYASLLGLRRWQIGGAGRARRLAVLETVRLSPRQAIHLVRAGERWLLVGATDQALALLSEIEAEPEAAPAAQPAPRPLPSLDFREVLRSIANARPGSRA